MSVYDTYHMYMINTHRTYSPALLSERAIII